VIKLLAYPIGAPVKTNETRYKYYAGTLMAFPLWHNRLRPALTRSVVHRGISGTLAYCAYYPLRKLQQRLTRLTPGFQRWNDARVREQMDFDQRYGVETYGDVYPKMMESLGENRFHGNHYSGVVPSEFSAMMAQVTVPHATYCFIDYGSGKGRALMLAVAWGFARIIGIEYDRELHELAEKNLAHFTPTHAPNQAFELHCVDAAAYELPSMPAVIFIHNSFGAKVIAQVLERIRQSLATHPRDLWIIYCYPLNASGFDESNFLSLEAASADYRIYRAV
jgi:hypothetical protein